MRFNFAMFAQGARVLETGGLDIYNPITDLSAKDFPAVHQEAVIIVNFFPEDSEEHELVVSINGGYKKDCIEPYKTKMRDADNSGHSIGHVAYLQGISFEQPGQYKVEVSIDGQIVSTQSFVVKRTEDACPIPGGGCEGK